MEENMRVIIVSCLFKLLIGTCLYIHAPILAVAYGLVILFSLYKDYEKFLQAKKIVETMASMGYEQTSPGVYEPKLTEEDDNEPPKH